MEGRSKLVTLALVALCGLLGLWSSLSRSIGGGYLNEHTKTRSGSRPRLPKVPIDQLAQQFSASRLALLQQLEADYGTDTMRAVFLVDNDTAVTTGRTAFEAGANASQFEQAWNQLRDKMLIKLLQVHLGEERPQWIWAAGGHSSAAGHGNFYNQSYTASMSRAIAPVFASVGIEFVGRNYGMGGTQSGTEVSSCVESIFGNDINVLSWDFGMTDGGGLDLNTHYFYRALRLPSRPAVMSLHTGWYKYGRDRPAKELVNKGMPAFLQLTSQEVNAFNAIPDMLGKTEDEIADMPPYVQYMKCGGKIEGGDPGCGTNKYTTGMCDKDLEKMHAGWHPGWRVHALTGNHIALFQLEVLQDAVAELQALHKKADGSEEGGGSNKFDAAALLQQLRFQDQKTYESFMELPVHERLSGLVNATIAPDIDPNVFSLAPNVCRTGRLPAQSRFRGIMLETGAKGLYDFRETLTQEEVDSTPNVTDSIRLVQDPRNARPDCDVMLNMDFRDFYYLHYREGQKKLVAPNPRERLEYLPSNYQLKGYILMCNLICPWGYCPPGDIPLADVSKYSMSVNGHAVKGFTKFQQCGFLQREDSSHVWPINKNGQYEIVVQALVEDSFLRISSIVMY